jgi:hypothetical protein
MLETILIIIILACLFMIGLIIFGKMPMLKNIKVEEIENIKKKNKKRNMRK